MDFDSSKFITDFFNQLNNKSFKYCVLRNYQSLPKSTDGSDIDILVDEKKIKSFLVLVHSISREFCCDFIIFYKSGGFYRICICKPDLENGWGLQLDIHTDELYKGLPFYDKEILLSHTNTLNEIKVLNPKDSAVLSLIKEVFFNGVSRKNYYSEAVKSYKENPEHFYTIFEKYYGFDTALAWKYQLSIPKSEKQLKKIANKSRKAVFLKSLFDKPLRTLRLKTYYHLDRAKRIISPIGYSVAILGTDGSGKTTIIAKIRPVLELAIHGEINYEHMRPNLFPSISQLVGKKSSSGPVTEPHSSEASGILGSIIRVGYYSLDYIFGYWLKVYPILVKRPSIFIFDRYYHDFMIDPMRSRLSLNKNIIECISKIYPRPDIIICLGTNPEIIHERKPELPLEELQRQVNSLKLLCDKNTNAVWVDTGKSINQSANEVLSIITQKMSSRYNHIFTENYAK